MADITAFPIPNKVLDPEDYPEFKGEPGDAGPATEWRATATHLQQRPVGGSTWVDVVALSEITGADADLTPIPAYTETGATLSFVAEASGDIEIPGDGKIYALTITGDCSLVSGDWPTAPECANVTIAILIDAETPPAIAVDASWNWSGSTATEIPTEDGARCILQLASYPQGWIEASVREIGVPT